MGTGYFLDRNRGQLPILSPHLRGGWLPFEGELNRDATRFVLDAGVLACRLGTWGGRRQCRGRRVPGCGATRGPSRARPGATRSRRAHNGDDREFEADPPRRSSPLVGQLESPPDRPLHPHKHSPKPKAKDTAQYFWYLSLLPQILRRGNSGQMPLRYREGVSKRMIVHRDKGPGDDHPRRGQGTALASGGA